MAADIFPSLAAGQCITGGVEGVYFRETLFFANGPLFSPSIAALSRCPYGEKEVRIVPLTLLPPPPPAIFPMAEQQEKGNEGRSSQVRFFLSSPPFPPFSLADLAGPNGD